MILRSPAEDERPAIRHAGMDSRHPGPQDASGNIHVTWIPALHAGMTESRVPLQLTETLLTRIFKGGREEPDAAKPQPRESEYLPQSMS
jgi:hypothetical protein